MLTVQLKPGTEVAVAPKRRKMKFSSPGDCSIPSEDKIHLTSKALLRIQDPDSRFIHNCESNGLEMGVVITSAVFIHPETAKIYSFDSLQLVNIEPRLAPEERKTNHDANKQKRKSSTAKEVPGVPFVKQDHRQIVVRLLISGSVAKGHIMLSRSLRLYLRASRHSCTLDFP